MNHRDPSKREGYIMLAPYSDCPTPEGWSREESGTLRECYELQRRLQEQDYIDWKLEATPDMDNLRLQFKRTRDAMLTRMASSSTTPFDRDFMESYLKLQEDKLAKHEQRFEHRNAYLRSLEFDTPKGRRDDEESFKVDRIG